MENLTSLEECLVQIELPIQTESGETKELISTVLIMHFQDIHIYDYRSASRRRSDSSAASCCSFEEVDGPCFLCRKV